MKYLFNALITIAINDFETLCFKRKDYQITFVTTLVLK